MWGRRDDEGGPAVCLGIPARVVEPVDRVRQTVLVDSGGHVQQVSAAMLMDDSAEVPQPGDWVVVHLGFALSRMDDAEARSVLASLDDLNDLYADQLEAHAAETQQR
ncbi:MAG: HypC/HybG/HupF family hydrogenase formation chaperone [Nocardioides sp.]